MINMLKICAIATKYAKTSSIKRSVSPNTSDKTDLVAAKLFLESLGPNNELSNATTNLDILLNAERSMILAKLNRRTSHLYREFKESRAVTQQINENTIELRETFCKEKQKDREAYSAVEQTQRHLSVAMDRLESLSGASNASVEEVKELLLSIVQGRPLFSNTQLTETERKACSQDNELAELRSWLEPVEHYEEDYIRKLSLRGLDTCDWIFNPSDTVGKTLSQWLNAVNNPPSIVWLTGSPGQGKSVLAGYLIKTCKEKNGECLFFFCRHDDEAKRSIPNILRTVAYSLAVAEKKVRMNYLAQKNQGVSLADMSPVMLWERLFKNNLRSDLSRTIHWVIDGFDELEEQYRGEFASLLAEAAQFNLGFKVLVVSRDDRVVDDAFEHDDTVKTVKLNKKRTNNDIRKFITTKVKKKFPALSEEARQRVIDGLTKKSGALFLWATLALNIVCRKHSESTLFKALDELPLDSQMKSLYSMIVRRLGTECSDPGERDIAKALHTWILCSFRPLSLSELKCALELKFGSMFSPLEFKRAVRDFGGSLIEIGEDAIVTFVHATVKEFLMSEDAGEFRISEEVGSRYISGVCLEYLTGKVGNLERNLHGTEDAIPEPERLQTEYVLLQYAAQYVFQHIQFAQTEISLDFLYEIISFLGGAWSLTWIEALGTFGSIDALPAAASIINSLQSTLNVRQKEQELLSQAAIDLSRIALQIDEKISEHPCSIHVSLSSMFPQECVIGQRARHDSAKCLYPVYQRWSPVKAYRASGHDPTETRLTLTFTTSGEYLVYAQLRKSPWTVDVFIYQTQTYQPIIRLEPLVDGKAPGGVPVSERHRGPVGILVGEHYHFLEVLCSSANCFRVLVAYETGRGFFVENELYLKCVLAEYTSESPYQGGKWTRSVQFDFPVSRDFPKVRVAMNPRGQQILAWGNQRVFFWRNINVPHVTFAFNTTILAADFALIDGRMVILCIVPQGLRIRDPNTFRELKMIVHDFGRATDLIIDTLTGNVLICLPGGDNFIKIQLGVNSNGYCKSLRDPRSNIHRYFGSLRSETWSYVVWESNGRRLLVRSETKSVPQIYPNPTKNESVVPSIQRHRFVVIDDLSEPPLPTSNGHLPYQEEPHAELIKWQGTIREQEDLERFWIHGHSVKHSPCTKYMAFTGCDRPRHPDKCQNCEEEPSRLGIGDRSTGALTIWLPTEDELDIRAAKVGFAFDRYSRLFIFSNQGRGIFIYTAEVPPMTFRIKPLGLLRLDDILIPPVIYAQSKTTLLLICYSCQKRMEVWKLELEARNARFSQHMLFDKYVLSAEIHRSLLVFVTSLGWLCSFDLNDEIDEIRHHFRLPTDLLLPQGEGTDLCNLKSTVDGMVTIRDVYGERWEFWIASIGQALQSVEY